MDDRKVGANVENEVDRQTEFERLFMNDDLLYGDDWYIEDEILEIVSIVEYNMYDLDCNEVLIENAE